MTDKTEMVEMVEPGGNTKPPAKKRISAAKMWCFTWHNPNMEMVELVENFRGFDYIVGNENGQSGETPHYQGAVRHKTLSFRPMEKFGLSKEIHWEKCKGSWEDQLRYCSKEGDYKTNCEVPRVRELPKIELYGWQLEVKRHFEAHEGEDPRSIYWVWSEMGNRGKSSMVRWLVRNGALICGGKTSDMKYLVVKYHQTHGVWPHTIVVNVPKKMKDFLSYQGLEEIKDGVFASTKYECETVEMPHPAVYVFANFPPSGEDMSADRFIVTNVDEGNNGENQLFEEPWG